MDPLEDYQDEMRKLLKQADSLDEEVRDSTRSLIEDMRDRILANFAFIQARSEEIGQPGWGGSWLPALSRAYNAVIDNIGQQFGEVLQKFSFRAVETGRDFADQTISATHPGIDVLDTPRIDPESLKLASQFSPELITNMTEDQKKRIGREVALSVSLGEAPTGLIRRLSTTIDKGPWKFAHYRAEIIARTEIARIQELGRKLRFEQQLREHPGITIYQQFLVAKIREYPCDVCKPFNGMVYEFNGKPYWPEDAPPMPEVPIHPNCRCGWIPWVPGLSPLPSSTKGDGRKMTGKATAEYVSGKGWVIDYPRGGSTVIPLPANVSAQELEKLVASHAENKGFDYGTLDIIRVDYSKTPEYALAESRQHQEDKVPWA